VADRDWHDIMGGCEARESTAVRRAGPQDAGEVVRLAALMYEALGWDPASEDWRRAACELLNSRPHEEFNVLVVDDPDTAGRLAAIGGASIATRLPGPRNPTGRVGYIQWISTDPSRRRRGLARLITAGLLDWLEERGASAVELHATTEGEGLYRALGFTPGEHPALRARLDG
jgi:ribosomal protein S18 acetylase RimI-like enzyme